MDHNPDGRFPLSIRAALLPTRLRRPAQPLEFQRSGEPLTTDRAPALHHSTRGATLDRALPTLARPERSRGAYGENPLEVPQSALRSFKINCLYKSAWGGYKLPEHMPLADNGNRKLCSGSLSLRTIWAAEWNEKQK